MRDPIVITIQPGESLSRMAAQHGVRVEDLQRWNAIRNPDLIRIGQEIVVHIPPPTPETSPTATPLHSEKGQTPIRSAPRILPISSSSVSLSGVSSSFCCGGRVARSFHPRVYPPRAPHNLSPHRRHRSIMGNVVSVLN